MKNKKLKKRIASLEERLAKIETVLFSNDTIDDFQEGLIKLLNQANQQFPEQLSNNHLLNQNLE